MLLLEARDDAYLGEGKVVVVVVEDLHGVKVVLVGVAVDVVVVDDEIFEDGFGMLYEVPVLWDGVVGTHFHDTVCCWDVD